MGCEGGLVFTASHELIHSRHPTDRLLGDALLASMFYMHWYATVVVCCAVVLQSSSSNCTGPMRTVPTTSRWLNVGGCCCTANTVVDNAQVATPDDPATGRLHESLYAFLPRCIAGAWRDGVDMELQRLHATNTTWWSPHNRYVERVCGHVECKKEKEYWAMQL